MNHVIDAVPLVHTRASVVVSGTDRIGALLVDAGKLSVHDAERVLHLQKEHGLRFGEAAIKLGLVREADIQQILARQFHYPVLIPGESPVSSEVLAAFDPSHPAVSAFRAIRSQLMLRWLCEQEHTKTVAIASPRHGDGRSFIAADLAVVFSQLGERTLLIDADLRRPRQHSLFWLQNREGLSSTLSGRAEREVIQVVPGLMSLSVLTAGPVPPNPEELLSRPMFEKLIASVRSDFDVVILDTSATVEAGDAVTVAARCGATLLLGRKDRSRVAEMRDLTARMRDAKVEVVGLALNER